MDSLEVVKPGAGFECFQGDVGFLHRWLNLAMAVAMSSHRRLGEASKMHWIDGNTLRWIIESVFGRPPHPDALCLDECRVKEYIVPLPMRSTGNKTEKTFIWGFTNDNRCIFQMYAWGIPTRTSVFLVSCGALGSPEADVEVVIAEEDCALNGFYVAANDAIVYESFVNDFRPEWRVVLNVSCREMRVQRCLQMGAPYVHDSVYGDIYRDMKKNTISRLLIPQDENEPIGFENLHDCPETTISPYLGYLGTNKGPIKITLLTGIGQRYIHIEKGIGGSRQSAFAGTALLIQTSWSLVPTRYSANWAGCGRTSPETMILR